MLIGFGIIHRRAISCFTDQMSYFFIVGLEYRRIPDLSKHKEFLQYMNCSDPNKVLCKDDITDRLCSLAQDSNVLEPASIFILTVSETNLTYIQMPHQQKARVHFASIFSCGISSEFELVALEIEGVEMAIPSS